MEHQLSNEERVRESERERERKNRFAYSGADTPRSASQPPTTNGDGFFSTTPGMQIYAGSPGAGRNGNGNGNGNGSGGSGTLGAVTSPWAMPGHGHGRPPSLGRSASSSIGIPSSLPHSSSLSERSYAAGAGGGGQAGFANAIRESHSFQSTFEDDESEVLSDATGEFVYAEATTQHQQLRGRHFFPGDTRSRSQSLATATASRPLPIGSPPTNNAGGLGGSGGWGTGPLSIPGRFADIKAPGSGSGFGAGTGTGTGSRYGSLGALARSPAGASPSPTAGLRVNTAQQHGELTNISPLTRDVGQIMLDEDLAWAHAHAGAGGANMNGNNGGDSGTTSRRHSVSVVQPRRGIVGFNAPDSHGGAAEDNGGGGQFYNQNGLGHAGAGVGGSLVGGGGGGGLAISDDELAVGLNTLSLNQPARTRSSFPPPSQPSSLPIYAPLSRTTQTHEAGSGSLAESLSTYAGSEHFPSRRVLRSPSESGYSVSSSGGSPPPRNIEHSPALESAYIARQHQHQQQQQRYVPGQGFQYIPEDGPAPNPPSPTFMRSMPGPNQSFMQMHGQMPLSPARGHAQQMQMQQFLQQQQLGGAPVLQRRTSQGEGFVGMGVGGQQMQMQTQHHHQQQQQAPLSDLGRGIPLHAVPSTWALYIVEFKAGRTDLFYVPDAASIPPPGLRVGDLVIVEADRGKDLGKIVNDTITAGEVEAFQRQQAAIQAAQQVQAGGMYGGDPTSPDSAGPGPSPPHVGLGPPPPPHGKKEINPKKIYGKATAADAQLLVTKHQDEAKALALCQSKVKQKKLPMEVIDAEYQWDRRKLTFYFVAEKRIDFRELVRELFRLYKTRIWMASLQGPTSPE